MEEEKSKELSANDYSDGEIIDDDDVKEAENSLDIKVSKSNTLKKNFRSHKNSDDDQEEEIVHRKDASFKAHNDKRRNRRSKSRDRVKRFKRDEGKNDNFHFRVPVNPTHQPPPSKYVKHTTTKPSITFWENPRRFKDEKSKEPKRKREESHHKKPEVKDVKPKSQEEKVSPEKRPQKDHPSQEKVLEEDSPVVPKEKERLQSLSESTELIKLNQSTIPEVVESPPRSPVISGGLSSPSNSSFKKNFICSFLSDLESEGYLSSLSLTNEIIDTDTEDECDTPIESKLEPSMDPEKMIKDLEESSSTSSNENDDSDCEDSDSSTDSSSSSSESEEEDSDSDMSSLDGPPPASGFGRFDSSTMPVLPPPTNLHKIEPNFLKDTTISKPSLFTPAAYVTPQTLPTFKMGAAVPVPGFQIPFKIYSLRDLPPANQMIYKLADVPKVTVVETPKKPEKPEKNEKSEKPEKSEREKEKESSRSNHHESDRKESRDSARKSDSHRKKTRDDRDHEISSRKRDRKRSPSTSKRSFTPPMHREDSKKKPDKRSDRREPEKKSLPRHSRKRSRSRSRSPKKRELSSRNVDPRKYSPIRKHSMSSHERSSKHDESSSSMSKLHDYDKNDRHPKSYLPSNEENHSNMYNNSYSQQYYGETFEHPHYYDHHHHHHHMEDEKDLYSDLYPPPSEYFINNSNLVEITQQKRERQRIESNQITVQVGNVLEIVPCSELPEVKPLAEKNLNNAKELKQRRKLLRERKRNEKMLRKEKLRNEIQRLLDSGVCMDDSDDESAQLEPLKASKENVPGILKKSNRSNGAHKRVVFADGLFPFEVSDHEADDNSQIDKLRKMKAERRRKIRQGKNKIGVSPLSDGLQSSKKESMYNSSIEAPPPPPAGDPPKHLLQPTLKPKLAAELFASFSINPAPMYLYLNKYYSNGFNKPSVRVM